MKNPFRRRARKGSVYSPMMRTLASAVTLRACGQIQRSPWESLGMAAAVRVRETRRVAGRHAWLHPFHHHAFDSWQRWRDSNPVDAVLETAALAAELHLVKTKRPPRSFRGGLPIRGLSSVVSRHRQADL